MPFATFDISKPHTHPTLHTLSAICPAQWKTGFVHEENTSPKCQMASNVSICQLKSVTMTNCSQVETPMMMMRMQMSFPDGLCNNSLVLQTDCCSSRVACQTTFERTSPFVVQRWRVHGSIPMLDKKMEGVLVAGEAPVHLQSTTEVLLCKILNPPNSQRVLQRTCDSSCTLWRTSPICSCARLQHTLCDLVRDEGKKGLCVKFESSAETFLFLFSIFVLEFLGLAQL